MKQNTSNIAKRTRRHAKIRAKIFGTSAMPRLSVFKSNKAIYAQIIDDTKGNTIASSDSRKSKVKTLSEKAKEVGMEIAKIAKEKKVEAVVFDRSGYIYTGVIKIVKQ